MKKSTSLLILSFVFSVFTYSPAYSTAVTATPTSTVDPVYAKIKAALHDFFSLSKHERKVKIREARKLWKEYKADVKSGKAKSDDNHILAIIFAILIPPVGVLIYEGKITTKFWIALLLTLLFWLPGAIYALLVVTGNA